MNTGLSLFQTIGLILKFWNEVMSFVKWLEQNKADQWDAEGNAFAKQLNQAKTDEERRALLHKISDHSSSLP